MGCRGCGVQVDGVVREWVAGSMFGIAKGPHGGAVWMPSGLIECRAGSLVKSVASSSI